MIYLKSESEIDKMREAAQLVSRTLGEVGKVLEPGVETGKLDRIAEEYILKHEARPAFKGYGGKKNPFPATLCISINEEVVHGIPGKRVLKEGDVVSVDCGVELNGFFGDHAYTFIAGETDEKTVDLLRTTLQSLYIGIDEAVHGNRIGDIGSAIQNHCEDKGFGVVRDLVGHGIGKNMHEEPSVPNYGRPGKGERLRTGMGLAIEPMITAGTWKVSTLDDGWTIVTADGSNAAHFEHDIIVREGKAEILSTFDYIAEITKNKILETH
ncbi:type I methionyl aminopeptidase [Rhodohalobacter sp. SW132]|uniref:type I methionyl aminopeptidase n=1 Tax=Rhodohalobacter sp. SW132 TaxID=2293433 RepID=UPI000E25634D|nr:type I methionyl aminopeptidase [Rhodohalobacter sp. SW132]REL23965.1 type I methionyl aminopeptidase [Rhodohalobacter sp. SW132]